MLAVWGCGGYLSGDSESLPIFIYAAFYFSFAARFADAILRLLFQINFILITDI